MYIVKTEKLSFRYPLSGHEYYFPDIELAHGESLLLTGKSGSGKTTLLHLLAGVLSRGNGTVFIDNISIGILKSHEMDKFRVKKWHHFPG
jgi:putative ABC transport system ATP-binding protein